MIGVFDSGSGGLTILAALRARFPDRDFLYLGDHARAPYGHRSNADIVAYTQEGVDQLMQAGCSLVILACNTAAAIALRSLQQNWLDQAWPGRRVLGVLVPMVESLTGQPWTHDHEARDAHSSRAPKRANQTVLLFATRKTVESGAYADEIRKRAPEIRLVQKACPGLVDAIEGGAGTLPLAGLVQGYVQEALAALDTMPDQVFLGCTHFPLVEAQFQSALGMGVPILGQPDIVAHALDDYLTRHAALVPAGSGQATLTTTGEPGDLQHLIAFLSRDKKRANDTLAWPSFVRA